MVTLSVKTITPRVIANRTRKVHLLTWNKFEAALRQVSRDNPEMIKALPRIFWLNQLSLWNRNYRGSDMHALTFRAGELATRFPMGH